MNDINDYVKKYGVLSFKEKTFNDIDGTILAQIAYYNFKEIVPSNKDKISLGNAIRLMKQKYGKKNYIKRKLDKINMYRLATLLSESNRYSDILLYNYIYKLNDKQQFCAVTMKLPNDIIYVCFEGTDEMLSGWEEDFELSYNYPIKSHLDATKYLYQTISLKDRNIIVGGHSKGGNLALVAAMESNIFLKARIKKIYTIDGVGLRKKEIDTLKFKTIQRKIKSIIPDSSIVGLLLRHNYKINVVKSNRKSFLSHSVFSWKIKDDEFVSSKLSTFSKNFDISMNIWLDAHDYEERKRFSDTIFKILRSNKAENLSDVAKLKNIIKMIKGSKTIDKESKELVISCLKFNFQYCINNK